MEGTKGAFSETVYDHLGQYYLQYIIIESEDPSRRYEEYSKVFSLLVLKILSTEENESCFVYDVARSYEGARRILCVMRDNTVTPCTVREVLDDVL